MDERTHAPVKTNKTAYVCDTSCLMYNKNGTVISELLYGERVFVFEEYTNNKRILIQNVFDNYLGYINPESLTTENPNNAAVISVATAPVFAEPDLKSEWVCNLPLNAKISIFETQNSFLKTHKGWVYHPHTEKKWLSPADIAHYFLGTPYLWGGKTYRGLDCSGLVQVCFQICQIALPRDADMQENFTSQDISIEYMQKDDLVFWKGHVAIAINRTEILHANATNMYVERGDLHTIAKSIASKNGGYITSIKRISKEV